MHVARGRQFAGWWRRDRSRDDEARQRERFEALFMRHYPLVYRILFSLSRSPELAEDMAQEVFLRFHRQPGLLHALDDREVGKWLAKVATNVGLNALREGRRRQARERAEAILLAPEAVGRERAADPALYAAAREEAALIEAVLSTMAERARACLVLRHSGLSYNEVAAAVDIAPASVGTVLARAEREFRRRYVAAGGTSAEDEPTATER